MSRTVAIASASFVLAAFFSVGASADQDDPPTRAARLAYVDGSVAFGPAGTSDWVAPPINRPLTTGDQLWSDQNSRAEVQFDGSSLRLSANTAVTLLNLSDTVTQIQLSSGAILLRVRRFSDEQTYEVDTPNLAFTVLRPGLYRISVDGSGNSTAIRVRQGQGDVTGGGLAYPVAENEYDVFSGTDELREDQQPYGADQDSFEAWGAARDSRWDHSVSARYVSRDVVGYEDLDDQGSWSLDPVNGNVWFPRGVESGWAPYHNGHWAFVEPWGYTWIDDSAWGFAPFHYGRWVSVRGAWGWIPAPPQRPDVAYVRPVYAPALVAWIGAGAAVAWFALGPREVYVPSYPVSRAYVNNINVSNTTVNTTVINNVYNTTIVNNTVVNNITYANRNVPGAVVATTSQAFTSAQPVARNAVHLDQRAIASASVAALAPAVVPTKQAVIGSGHVSATRPPASVQSRVVVARIAPPAAPPSFERRRDAIQSNGGKPLSTAQVRQISGTSAAQTQVVVKLAPAARMMSPAKLLQPPTPTVAIATPRPNTDMAVPRAPEAPVKAAPLAANPIHPRELPPPPKLTPPAKANSVLERQHLQEQQQLQAKQNADREQLQQRQEAEHAQATKDAAAKARQQQIEQQHQLQTLQLMQKHAEAQKQLEEKQQEQRRLQESQAPPRPHKPEPQPQRKPL